MHPIPGQTFPLTVHSPGQKRFVTVFTCIHLDLMVTSMVYLGERVRRQIMSSSHDSSTDTEPSEGSKGVTFIRINPFEEKCSAHFAGSVLRTSEDRAVGIFVGAVTY